MTVQRMVSRKHSTELILGCKRDLTFGTVMLIGTGGIAAECFRDRALGLPPLNERLASRMLESLRSWPLLRGFRGRPGVNLDRLLEVMIRFSYMVADHPEITEFDINPLLASRKAFWRWMVGRLWNRYRRTGRITPSNIWRSDRGRGSSPDGQHWRTAGRCCCGRSVRKMRRCGTRWWRPVRRVRSGSGSGI